MNAHTDPSRLLIVRNDRVGDLVLTMPTIEYVRRLYPSAHITVLASQRTSALLQRHPQVDQVIADDRRSSTRQLAVRLRRERFDAALVIHASTRNFMAVWLAGVPVRVTWARRPAGWLLGNRHVKLRRSHPPIHESEFALAFARALRADPSIEVSTPSLHLDPQTVSRVRARIVAAVGNGPLFGVHPGNYNSAWNWPPQRYLELIAQLARHACVVVTGGPGEEDLLLQLQRGLPSGLAQRVAFFEDFDLSELCAALSIVDILTVSNTGPMHLASALGTPVVALFSGQVCQGAKKWGPLGPSNTVLEAPLLPGEEISAENEHEHMCRISLDEVIEANLRILHAQSTRMRSCA